MSLADNVSRFLLSDDIQVRTALDLLDFSLEQFQVDPEGYREIGWKIREGVIRVEPARRSADSPTEAVYTPLLNKLSLPADLNLERTSPQSLRDQVMIVHETTHALMDFHRYRTTSAAFESAAFVAGALYGFSYGLRQSSPNPLAEAILRAAEDIVQGRNMLLSRGVHLQLSDSDVTRLANAIAAHPAYAAIAGGATDVDGIGGLINPWYLPRH